MAQPLQSLLNDLECSEISADDVEITKLGNVRGVFNAKWDDMNYLAKSPEFRKVSAETFLKDCGKMLTLVRKNHPRIERIVGIILKNDIPYLITDYTDTTLSEVLRSSQSERAYKPSYEDKILISRNIASGLQFLHHTLQPAIVHGALCCDIIMVSFPTNVNGIQAKLSDLSKAKPLGSDWDPPSSDMFPYLPPPYRVGALKTERLNLHCEMLVDIYSLAIVMVAVETNQIPSLDVDATEFMDREKVLYNVAYNKILTVTNLDQMLSAKEIYKALQTDSSKEGLVPNKEHQQPNSFSITISRQQKSLVDSIVECGAPSFDDSEMSGEAEASHHMRVSDTEGLDSEEHVEVTDCDQWQKKGNSESDRVTNLSMRENHCGENQANPDESASSQAENTSNPQTVMRSVRRFFSPSFENNDGQKNLRYEIGW